MFFFTIRYQPLKSVLMIVGFFALAVLIYGWFQKKGYPKMDDL